MVLDSSHRDEWSHPGHLLQDISTGKLALENVTAATNRITDK